MAGMKLKYLILRLSTNSVNKGFPPVEAANSPMLNLPPGAESNPSETAEDFALAALS
jgi:hypothetical protein